jgi:outer membrane protein TolC
MLSLHAQSRRGSCAKNMARHRSSLRGGWLTIALLASAVASAQSAPAPLTTLPAEMSLKQALDLFSHHGLDLLIAEASVEGAQGDQRAAGALKNPLASFGMGPGLDCTKHGCPVLPDLQYVASLSDNALIEDVASGKRGLRLDVAGRALYAARLNREDARRTSSCCRISRPWCWHAKSKVAPPKSST